VDATKLQVAATKTYYTAYNLLANAKTLAAGELGADGYASAYTEIEGKANGESSDYTGKCTTGTGGTQEAIALTVTTDFDDTVTLLIGF